MSDYYDSLPVLKTNNLIIRIWDYLSQYPIGNISPKIRPIKKRLSHYYRRRKQPICFFIGHSCPIDPMLAKGRRSKGKADVVCRRCKKIVEVKITSDFLNTPEKS